MSQDHHLAQIGARRCISVLALVFAIVLMIQYSEFPYGAISSVETPVSTFSMVNNSTNITNSKTLLNVTSRSGGGGGGMELVPKDKLVSERNNETDTSFEGDDVIDPEDESHFKNFTLGDDPLLNFRDNSSLSLDNSSTSNSSSMVKDAEIPSLPDNQSSIANFPPPPPPMNKGSARKSSAVSIADMNNLLLESRASSFSMKPHWSLKVDSDLRMAKTEILNTSIVQSDYELYAPLYRNMSMFRRSYELMESILKVYVYKEGERPIFHTPVLKGIYASEGWFMKQLKSSKHYITKNPRKAHLFYLPFSSRMLEETLYVPNSHSRDNLVQHLKNYLDTLVNKYDFWNRTGGADHFLVACHDWAPAETRKLMAYCIRALCNSDIKEGFKFGKDVSLPETYIRSPQNPLKDLGGKPASQRKTLAFFAGNMHGYLRYELLKQWENKDPDMKIFGKMRKPTTKGQMNYVQYMKSSKYCICAKGYEVNSPRVVEAIFYECVPVIISDRFVPPFFEILNWESFAVFVPEKEMPNLKKILSSISDEKYLEMQRRVKKVQQHFLWHSRPVKYDIFHMILHSIWYNRVLLTSNVD
ncbi:probable glycosyltransferase At5g03795 [Impatiens glandulifera]|uniref:probable glycosyltransferase At5g03795 n=1 Tax=Impatiens glandulifera TaxID=253017 RepID=UPI001FB17B84|nr:probable glycosyltransferase At5g03795 [Impatiens glandulifera]